MAGLENQTFAGYEIISELGRGGMGAVYKARQPKLDRLVALKIMATELAGDPDFVARFKREANAAAALNHQNIVQVFSAGECEKTHYIAMEFVEGETLRHHIESQGRLDPREAVAITVLVAQALQYAWNKARIIHRDIKPENIFLSHAGEVKVGDLGLAKTVGGGSTSLTQTGMMMGSPHYISPEQARGLSDIDFRTDIYSLGCTLYHMLTGRPPYEGSDPLVVINKHVNAPPPAMFKVWPTCPIPLALAVGKMLAKQRHERPASYEDLIEQLREVHGKLKPATTVASVSASEPTQVLPTPKPAPTQPTPKPAIAKTPKPAPAATPGLVIHNWKLVMGGVAAIAVLLAGLMLWSPWKPSSTAPVDTAAPEPGAIRLWDSPDDIAKEPGVTWENSAVVFGSPYKRVLKGDAPASRDAIVRAEISMNRDAAVRWLGLRYVKVSLSGDRIGENSHRLEVKNDRVSLMSIRASRSNTLQTWQLPRTYGTNEWLRLEMRTIGDEVTVSADGHVLGNIRDTSQPEPGCPMIRGENASFRNIVYVPLDKPGNAALQTQAPIASSEAALKQLGNVFINAVGAEMVAIPPGEFMMGSTPEERAWAIQSGTKEADLIREGEAPRKTVIKQDFWMGRTKMTVGQWRQFVNATGYVTEGEKRGEVFMPPNKMMKGKSWRDPGFGVAVADNHPVCAVSWNDAMAFCQWLMEQERKAGRLAGGFAVRLPTEGEWEYACRAGTQTKFWWGESTEDSKGRLNGRGTEDGFEFISPVDFYGERGRNKFGLADMLGNVWEWCLDGWHSQQAQSEYFKGSSTGYVVRGGTFARALYMNRVAYRGYAALDNADVTRGFRVCLGPDVLGSAASAVSNAQPVITNWQDVMPYMRIEMEKKRAARQEDGWIVATQNPRGAANICSQPLGDIAIRGRFRNECQVHLTVAGTPSKYYSVSLARGGGSCSRNHYEGSQGNYTLKIQPLGSFHYPSADEHDFLITRVGDLLSAWVDGAFAGSARDATLTSGTARLYLQHTSDAIRDLAIADLSAAAPATADADWQNAINLMPLIDLQKDVVQGTWTIQSGELLAASKNPGRSRVEIPYRPAAEYDLRVNFTRQADRGFRGFPNLILAQSGRQFMWHSDMPDTRAFGFSLIDGLLPPKNNAWVKRPDGLENGRRYTYLMQVRNGQLKAYLDNELMVQWSGEMNSLSLDPSCKLRSSDILGLLTGGCPVVFHKIELLEITGKGTFTRGAPADAATEEWTTLPNGWRFGKPANLGPTVNSASDDSRPTVSGDGMTLLFQSNRTGGSGRIWASTRRSTADTWGAPRDVEDVSTASHTGDPCLSPDGLTLFFSSTRLGGQGKGDLWMCSRRSTAEHWSRHENLGPVINSGSDDASPFLATDGLTLLFNSDRPGGQGSRDLWMSTRPQIGAAWSVPLNLGPPVNSKREESNLCLSTDGLALFFTSERDGGQGRRDLWMSTRRSKTESFGDPVNLGATVNTSMDESGPWLSADNRTLYFHSDRPDGLGKNDLWQVPVLPPDTNTPTLQHSNPPAPWLSAFCAEVAALPAEQQVARVVAKLKELNPGFDGQIKTSLLDDPGWAGITFSARGISNISPVRALTWLKEFTCSAENSNRSEFSDLSPLCGLQLRKVDCGWTRVNDLSPLRGMPLRTATFHNCPVSDFTPLEGCPIETLQMGAMGLRDLTQLRTLRLKNLNVNLNPISDLSPLQGMPLTILNLRRTTVRDLAPLQGMALTWLDCAFTAVTDFSPLRDVPLQTLYCEASVAAQSANAKMLRSMRTLETINRLPTVEFWKQVDAGKLPQADGKMDEATSSAVEDAFIKEVAALPAE